MKIVGLDYFKENVVGTTCGEADNVSLNDEKLLTFLERYTTGQYNISTITENNILKIQTMYLTVLPQKDGNLIPEVLLQELQNDIEFTDAMDFSDEDYKDHMSSLDNQIELISEYFEYLVGEAGGSLTVQGIKRNFILYAESE